MVDNISDRYSFRNLFLGFFIKRTAKGREGIIEGIKDGIKGFVIFIKRVGK